MHKLEFSPKGLNFNLFHCRAISKKPLADGPDLPGKMFTKIKTFITNHIKMLVIVL